VFKSQPKCGSTSLQRKFFFPSTALNYISPHAPEGKREGFPSHPLTERFFGNLQSPDFQLHEAQDIWRSHIEQHVISGAVNVLSHELVLNARAGFENKVQFIESLGYNSKIFITYRRPENIIRSYYDYAPYNIFDARSRRQFLDFDEWVNKCRQLGDRFIWEALRFEEIFPLIQKKFPNSLFLDVDHGFRRQKNALVDFFQVRPEEVMRFLNSPRENVSHTGLKRLSRAIFRKSSPSDYLSRRQLELIEKAVTRAIGVKKARINNQMHEAFDRDFYRTYEFLENFDALRQASTPCDMGPAQ
jgi:hypothetical protein